MNSSASQIESIPMGIALGSNQGDRLQNLREARSRIITFAQGKSEVPPACLSAPIYETEPVDCPPGVGPFLNTVVEVDCRAPFSPTKWLMRLQGIENSLGRPTRHPRNSARTIDLDILYAGRHHSRVPGLTLPHPRLAQRRFVLAPLAGIRPDLVLPGESCTVTEMLRRLEARENVALYASRW